MWVSKITEEDLSNEIIYVMTGDIIDIKNTALNNVADNLTLNAYSIPLRGDIIG